MKNANNLWKIYSVFYDSLLTFVPYKELVDKVARKLEVNEGETVLDIGSGTSNLEVAISKMVESVNFICLDLSEEMTARAKKKYPKADYKRYDINKDLIPASDETLDKVASINVVYTATDINSLFKDINRVLKSGGMFVFTTSVRSGFSSVVLEHVKKMGIIGFLKSLLYLPALIFVILINVIIDKKYSLTFYKKSFIEKTLLENGFEVREEIECYGNLNCLFVAVKTKNV
jgi:ubiquinone/menaquinone biosynthesis C-methylase UbiE